MSADEAGSSLSGALPPPTHQFSMQSMSDAELIAAIHSVPTFADPNVLAQIKIDGANGQHAALMRLNHPVRIQIEGSLGDYAYAYNAETDIRQTGNVGHGVGEGMRSGAVRIRGNAGVGAGAAMTGGTLAIYGDAGDRCGAGMRSGGIFVRGDVGHEVGVGAIGGMIVIGGDAGRNLGDAMNNVSVFIRGSAESLADGVIEAPLRKREMLRLGLLLINASIRGDAKEFRRVVPEAMLRAEEARRGEVAPNWR
ncbi:tributyrin esterase [Novipirellula sp.]|uniref:tributyrin esterase n=1 Tax=Novipirellula sp. TaxID=2795430 RepID=UPI003567C920